MSNLITGKLIVITGKSASGKDTVVAKILSLHPNLKRVITTTSRKIRVGEINGVDYHFTTEAEFRQKISNGELVEYVEYGGNLYGTFKTELENSLNSDLIWKIDPSRAGKIRDLIHQDLLVIYINTSDDVILQRLKKRGLSEEEIDKRMADDAAIWQEFKDKYDYIVENVPGKLDQTVDQIVKIISF